ncbi:MAG TPA: aldo/keto reductase, partial [Anaerolineae bacterium]
MSIAKISFGRLGHESTRTIFGAASLSHVSQSDADRTLDVLLQYGVNHIDVAASYGDAELRVAPWLKRHPNQFFLATKTGARSAQGGREELRRSLDRLGVDHVDLWQLHNLVDPIEWDQALSPGGVIEAAIEAKREGLIKGIGVTGHGLQIAATHRRSLERFDFDSVLLPLNYVTAQNAYYAANFAGLEATCRERNVAVQTIKSIAAEPWQGREHTRTTWYRPLEEQGDIDVAVWWVLG